MRDRALIYFRPIGSGLPQGRVGWLHWPALAFRIRANIPQARILDVFEELVLRLHIAGYRHPDEVCQLSGLAPELVTLVIAQLGQRRLLDSNGVTARGFAAIDAGAPLDTEVTLGWMLRCQLSGEIMPLFCEGDLPLQDRPTRPPYFNLPAFVSGREAGSSHDFQLAMRRWRQLLRQSDFEDRIDADDDYRSFPLDPDEAPPISEPIDVPGIPGSSLPSDEQRLALEIIDDPPRPVAVRMLIYLPHDSRIGAGNLEGLLTRHPYGIPGGDWYRRRLEASLPQLGQVAGSLREWARQARDERAQNRSADKIPLSELAQLGRQRATDLLGDVEDLHTALSMPMALLGEALVLAAKRPDRTDELRTRTCKVLEILFDTWIFRFGEHREAPSKWAAKRLDREEYIKAAATLVGVAVVPPVLLEAEKEGLGRAVNGKGDLRDRTVLVLTDAATAPGNGHPFALAVRRDPRLLERLDEIRKKRNRSVHFRRDQQPEPVSSAAAKQVIEHVETCLGVLFAAWREAIQPSEETIQLDF